MEILAGPGDCAVSGMGMYVPCNAAAAIQASFLPGERSLNMPNPDAARAAQIVYAAVTGNWKALLRMTLDPIEQDMWSRALNPIMDWGCQADAKSHGRIGGATCSLEDKPKTPVEKREQQCKAIMAAANAASAKIQKKKGAVGALSATGIVGGCIGSGGFACTLASVTSMGFGALQLNDYNEAQDALANETRAKLDEAGCAYQTSTTRF